MGSSKKEADIVVYEDDMCLNPSIIVECKKQDVTEAEFMQAIEQAASYAYALSGTIKYIWTTSLIRDSYLQIPGRSMDKVTHAYAYGGAELSMSTLNMNLDLNITEFATVNFNVLSDIVDSIDGVEIKITSDEVKYINKYISEVSKVSKISSFMSEERLSSGEESITKSIL